MPRPKTAKNELLCPHIMKDKHGYYIFANTEYSFLDIPIWWKFCAVCGVEIRRTGRKGK